MVCPGMGIDTDNRSPLGRFMLHIFAAFAEFEKNPIAERTSLGFRHYRELHRSGKIGGDRHSKSGKDLPVGRPPKMFDRYRVLELAKAGKSVRDIAADLKIGYGTARRVLAASRRDDPVT